MRIRCDQCFENGSFKYTGQFIYEDEPDRGYHNLRDPSYAELMTFLASDKTDEIPYSYPNFVCHNFSVTLREDANKQGFRCAIAQVYYVPIKNDQEVFYAHAFNTTDRGLIYIEPQNYQQYLITNQWQHWPCTVDPYSPNLTLDACSRALFLLYRVVLIW